MVKRATGKVMGVPTRPKENGQHPAEGGRVDYGRSACEPYALDVIAATANCVKVEGWGRETFFEELPVAGEKKLRICAFPNAFKRGVLKFSERFVPDAYSGRAISHFTTLRFINEEPFFTGDVLSRLWMC